MKKNYMIKSMDLRGLRSFVKDKPIHFAVPNGELGSGLTIFVGDNNSGKSTVLEAVSFLGSKYPFPVPKDIRNRSTLREVNIDYKMGDGQSHRFQRLDGGGEDKYGFYGDERSDSAARKMYPRVERMHYVRSRRTVVGDIQDGDFANREDQIILDFDPNRGKHPGHLINKRLVLWRDDSERIGELFRELWGSKIRWSIDSSGDKRSSIRIFVDDTEHHINDSGDGIASSIQLIDAFRDSSASMIIVDEPEISLNPTIQKKLFNRMKILAKNRQVIYATHSPHFIDIESLQNGAVLNRVFKWGNRSRVSSLNSETFKFFDKLEFDWRNPHKFGSDAKEIFFLPDKVIVCEGQEDVALLSKASDQLQIQSDGTFYGWGSAGVDNIPYIFKMLKCLGYSEVVAITDKIDDSRVQRIKDVSDQYRVYSLPTDDVRDKHDPETGKVLRTGIFDRDGNFKAKYESGMKKMFVEINQFFREKALAELLS